VWGAVVALVSVPLTALSLLVVTIVHFTRWKTLPPEVRKRVSKRLSMTAIVHLAMIAVFIGWLMRAFRYALST
jgi:hypothetical protein